MVAEVAVEEVGGDLPVVVGCTSYTPNQTIELSRHVASIGAARCQCYAATLRAPGSRRGGGFLSCHH